MARVNQDSRYSRRDSVLLTVARWLAPVTRTKLAVLRNYIAICDFRYFRSGTPPNLARFIIARGCACDISRVRRANETRSRGYLRGAREACNRFHSSFRAMYKSRIIPRAPCDYARICVSYRAVARGFSPPEIDRALPMNVTSGFSRP